MKECVPTLCSETAQVWNLELQEVEIKLCFALWIVSCFLGFFTFSPYSFLIQIKSDSLSVS